MHCSTPIEYNISKHVVIPYSEVCLEYKQMLENDMESATDNTDHKICENLILKILKISQNNNEFLQVIFSQVFQSKVFTRMLKMSKPSQSAMPQHISHTLYQRWGLESLDSDLSRTRVPILQDSDSSPSHLDSDSRHADSDSTWTRTIGTRPDSAKGKLHR